MTTPTQPQFSQMLLDAETKWARHLALLDGDSAYRLRGSNMDWLPRDEYAHHWRWLAHELAVARARVQGVTPPRISNVDAANEAWTAEDRSLSLDEARNLALAAWDEYLAFVRDLTPEQREGETLDSFFGTAVVHLDDHLRYMVDGALHDESSEWERLTAHLDGRPSGPLYRDDAGGEVTSAATYAHLARWMEVNLDRVQAFFDTGVVPDLEADVDVLNARWAQEDAALTLAESRRRAFLVRDRFMGQMRGIPIARFTPRLLGMYAGNSWDHYREHLGYTGYTATPL